MTNKQNTHKAFVKEDDSATIICPECSSAKIISVNRFRHRQHMLKVKCQCGHSFKMQLEFRRHFRKPTDLQGTYDLQPPARGGGQIRVINLSLSGLSFEVRGIHDFKIGQKGSLVFTLDNRKETVLYKKVIIKNVDKNRIGAEFIEDRAFEKELGFYLLP